LGVEDLSNSDVDGRFLLVVKELDKVIRVLTNGSVHSQDKANGRLVKIEGSFSPFTILCVIKLGRQEQRSVQIATESQTRSINT
jgi:hypothetical protein